MIIRGKTIRMINKRRAVSPVISTIMLIALVATAIGGVAVIMSNINEEGLPMANTENATIGSNNEGEEISIGLSITQLSPIEMSHSDLA